MQQYDSEKLVLHQKKRDSIKLKKTPRNAWNQVKETPINAFVIPKETQINNGAIRYDYYDYFKSIKEIEPNFIKTMQFWFFF